MAASTGVPSFDEIIQADRQRRKNEQLATEIFGRNRRANGAGNLGKKNTSGPTLASRIVKRSSSTNVQPSKANPFAPTKPPSRPSSAAAQHIRANRLASAVNNIQQANILPTPPAPSLQPGPGLSIKGTAGPFVVQASNFAPGTTAADIEAAMQTVAVDSTGNSGLVTCRILTKHPTVMAEMVFSERYIADSVVETFNNQKADGRILHVYLKPGNLSPALVTKKSEPSLTLSVPTAAPPVKDLFDTKVIGSEDVEMSTEPSYTEAREEADRGRRDREDRRAEPDVQDGRYGFEGGRRMGGIEEKPRQVLPPGDNPTPRADDGPAPQRRDEARERDYDNRYNDRRDDRGSYRRDGRYNEYRRDDRASHYGNGADGGGYRGSDGYGGMYSNDVVRGPPRGGRGGSRGGYR